MQQTGRHKQQLRETVPGFGRSEASSAVWAARRLQAEQNNAILIENLRTAGNLPQKAQIHLTPKELDLAELSFDDTHVNQERQHHISEAQAKEFIQQAAISVTVWNGRFERYYSQNGVAYVDLLKKEIRTAYGKAEYDASTQALMEALEQNGLFREY